MTHEHFRSGRLSLRFLDAGEEAAFAQEQARKAIRPLRAGLIFAIVMLVALYGVTDFILHELPSTVRGLVVLNLLVIGGLCALACGLTYWPGFVQRQQMLTTVFACLVSLDIPVVTSLGPADIVVSRGWGIMLLHTVGIYSLARLRFPAATLAGWTGLVIYCVYMRSIGLLDGEPLVRHALTLGFGNLWGMLICHQLDQSARHEFSAMQLLAREQDRSERLLRNILPVPIAQRLKQSGEVIAEHADEVTVLFADIVGFTPLAARQTPRALVQLLNRIFSEFDALADAHGLEKIKTIGDAYMAVAGLPEPRPDHAARAARMALAMLEATARVSADTGAELTLRIGLHSGPVVAGVIGLRKFAYDLWGDTVNTASRMEHHGLPGSVQCSETTAALLRGAFELSYRGMMDIKGKGDMATYLVIRPDESGRADADAPERRRSTGREVASNQCSGQEIQ